MRSVCGLNYMGNKINVLSVATSTEPQSSANAPTNGSPARMRHLRQFLLTGNLRFRHVIFSEVHKNSVELQQSSVA